ncbi:MAG TPA: O-antigen ligase family protein [Actinomycetota bacterium]
MSTTQARATALQRPAFKAALSVAAVVGAALGAAAFGAGLALVAVKFGGDAAPYVLAGLPLGALFVVMVLRRPRWGVLAVFATFPIGTVALPSTPLEVVEALAILVAVLLALNRLAQGKTMFPWAAPLWWALTLTGWSLVSLESAIDLDLGVRQILQLAGGLMFACVVVGVCTTMKELRWLVGSITAISAVIATIGLANARRFDIELGGAVTEGRLTGTFNDPNQLGAFAALTLFPAIGLIGGARTKAARALAAIASAVIAGALLLSLSRGAWVGVGLGFVFLIVAMPEFRRSLLALGVPVLIVAVALGAFAPDAPQVEVVGARLQSFTVLSPYDERDQIWAEGIREMREDPWTGVGPGSFPVASLRSASRTATVFAEHAHSIFFTWGAETGVPGLLLVIGFMASLYFVGREAIRTARRRARRRDRVIISGIAAGLVTVFGHGLLDYTLRNTVISLAVWSVIGAMLAAYRIQARAAAVEPAPPATDDPDRRARRRQRQSSRRLPEQAGQSSRRLPEQDARSQDATPAVAAVG